MYVVCREYVMHVCMCMYIFTYGNTYFYIYLCFVSMHVCMCMYIFTYGNTYFYIYLCLVSMHV